MKTIKTCLLIIIHNNIIYDIINVNTYIIYNVYYNVIFIWYIKCERGFLKCVSLVLIDRSKHLYCNSTDRRASKSVSFFVLQMTACLTTMS